MQKFTIQHFLNRSTDKPFEETTLAKVIADLPNLGTDGPWIAGGSLRRTLQNAEPDSDFDLFFRDAEQLAAFQAALLLKGFTVAKETDHHIEMVRESFRGTSTVSGDDDAAHDALFLQKVAKIYSEL